MIQGDKPVFGGQLLIGSAMIALTVVIHTGGLIALVAYLKGHGLRAVGDGSYFVMTRVLVLTILGIFLLHTLEIWCWAVLYLLLGELEGLERALYFSTVTYTTLGYGDIVLKERWQLLTSLEAANGIILFGVSTAFVFTVLRKLFDAVGITRPDD
jgi:hypothetical protein